MDLRRLEPDRLGVAGLGRRLDLVPLERRGDGRAARARAVSTRRRSSCSRCSGSSRRTPSLAQLLRHPRHDLVGVHALEELGDRARVRLRRRVGGPAVERDVDLEPLAARGLGKHSTPSSPNRPGPAARPRAQSITFAGSPGSRSNASTVGRSMRPHATATGAARARRAAPSTPGSACRCRRRTRSRRPRARSRSTRWPPTRGDASGTASRRSRPASAPSG